MFLKHLFQTIRSKLLNEYMIYQIENRSENVRIVRPFSVVSPDHLEIGKNVLIQRNCHFHCGGLSWSKGRGRIIVGDNCWFSENNVLYGAGGIEIDKSTGTAPGVMIFSSRDNYSLKYARLPNIVHQFGKVIIGAYVRIFTNVIIAPGVTIGEGAVIGAGSIVTKDVPPWVIAIGNPARVIRRREEDILLSERVKKG